MTDVAFCILLHMHIQAWL